VNETSLKLALYTWLSGALGQSHIFTLTFNADFVTGNVINGSFDAEAIAPVSFTTNHTTTLQKLAEEIQKRAEIFKATVTGARQITCIGAENGDTITVVGPTVTGGATQPVATVSTVTSPILVTVIFADQNSPRPPYPYAVVRLDTMVKIGWDEVREIDPDTNIATIGGQRRMTVSVSYFGPKPLEEIAKAYNALEKQTVHDQLAASGIAILEKNDVQNLTGMLETIFEERASFDFFIGFADNVEDDLGIIESVELTGQLSGGITGDIIVGPTVIGG